MSQMESLMDSKGHQCPVRCDSIAADLTPPGPVGRRWNPDWRKIQPQERRLSAQAISAAKKILFTTFTRSLSRLDQKWQLSHSAEMFRKSVSSFSVLDCVRVCALLFQFYGIRGTAKLHGHYKNLSTSLALV